MLVEIIITIILLLVISRYCKGKKYVGPKPDLSGKYAVVTGGNSGIGRQTAMDLAKQGCYVIIGARDTKKSDKAVEEIKKLANSSKIEHHYLDLSKPESIDEFVASIKCETIDFLVNNAGVMAFPKRRLSKEGFQMQYAVNHLGHFYLTYLLWKKLSNSQFFRIITVSSIAHKMESFTKPAPKLNFEDMNFEKMQYTPSSSYSYSKIYNVLFTHALAEKVSQQKGACYSLHPGFVRTEIIREIKPPLSYILKIMYPLFCIFSRNPLEGAQTSFHLLYTAPEKLKSGCYYSDCTLESQNKEVIKQNWDKLWEISERDLKIKFEI